MKNPTVTIGFMAFNRPEEMKKSLESLLKQTFTDFEVIISDDNSMPEVKNVATQYVHKDTRVRYIRHDPRIGQSANFNYVLREARGGYFMWAADDDWWDTQYLEELVGLFTKYPDAAIASCNFSLVATDRELSTTTQLPEYLPSVEAIKTYFTRDVMLIYSLYRTQLLKKAGGYHVDIRPTFFGGSDTVTAYNMLLYGGLAHSSKKLFYKRDSGSCLARHDTIRSLHFSPDVRARIKRYLLFWTIYIFDLCATMSSTLISPLPFSHKRVVMQYSIRYYVRMNKEYVIDLVKGLTALIQGVGKNLYRVGNRAKSNRA